MKKLIFGFSVTPHLLSTLIKDVQDLDVSHCYLQFEEDRYQETMVYEAKGLTTHFVNRNSFELTTKVLYEFEAEVSDEVFESIMRFTYKQAGTPYGWKEVFGYLIKWMANKVWIKIKNPFPTDGLVCSEALGIILCEFFGVKQDVELADMDLNWILKKLKENPNFIKTKGK